MLGRTSKQCRGIPFPESQNNQFLLLYLERWNNYLDPALSTSAFSTEEDALLVKLQSELGNQWAEISRAMPGRSEDAVKKRWGK